MHLTKNLSFTVHQLIKVTWLGLLLTSGCIRLEPLATATNAVASPSAALLATPTADYGWTNAQYVMQGVCFEAAEQLLDTVYTLRSSAELERFYSQIDLREYCQQPIKRETYPFSEGDVLVGIWNAAAGCTADHAVQAVERDPANRRIAIQLRLVTAGDCPYELIRPFWVVIHNADGYTAEISISKPE